MILSFVFFYQPNDVVIEETQLSLSETENVLFFGTSSGIVELDPQNMWDSASIDVVSQVVEGLFEHDLSDPDLAVIPSLALDHGTWNGNRYTLELKQGILFSDGTPFDAFAVKFSFDRLQYLIDNGYVLAADYYRYYDHQTDEMKPLINNVNVLNDYTVEFELDIPYGLFESILCFIGSSILSPTSTPHYDLIVDSSELVGTGPFTIEYIDPSVEISLRANDNYWKGVVDIDRLVFKIIPDMYERVDALINSEIHMIGGVPSDYIDIFEADPNIVVESVTSATVYYCGMNNYWLNKDVREAISYAIDYNYILDVITGGRALRSRSPIPNGILYSEDTFNVAETDLIHARTVMQSIGYGVGLDLYDDAAWESSTFMSYNFTYFIGHSTSENMFALFQDNLGKIGIEVTDAGMTWGDFMERATESPGYHREMLQLFWLGWGADYNDPSTFINPLFTNRTVGSNIVNYNGFNAALEAGRDPYNLWDNVQILMEVAIRETDPIIREQYYYRIQQLLVEQDRPWVFGYVPISTLAYRSEIQGFQWNAMGKLNFFGVTGIPYEEPEPEPPTILIVGSARILEGIDPLDVWDSGSYDIIDQVAEGLFGYDHSDPDNAIIPKLALSHGSWNGNQYTVNLREGVVFHDGAPFNADAVKFTFDRLQYFKDNGMLNPSSLYDYYDPTTGQTKLIINNVEVLSEYSVRFHLDVHFAPFEALLAAESSFILSPMSTPPTDVIDPIMGSLVGTGPFMYEYYDLDFEVGFRAFEDYWGGEPSIDYLKFRYISDANERADLLASGEIHMILIPPRDRRGEFEGNPDFTIDSIGGSAEYYLGMNNYWINRDLREAISYAIDYDYMINDLLDYDLSRPTSPIPNGIIYSYEGFNVPTLDIIYARTMMQSMGYGVGLDLYDEAAWESSTFLSLNYTYNIGSTIREAFYPFLVDNLGKIGIEVLDAGVGWAEFLERVFYEPERNLLQLFLSGWGADYNDPFNFINSQFTNRTTGFNTVNYNGFASAIEAGRDPFSFWDNVQLLMEAAIIETNPIIREQYYYRIQQLLVEEDMPWAYLYVYMRDVWYTSEIQGFQWNALEKLNFHGVSGVPYEEPEPELPTILILGSNRELTSIDPLNAWDHGSWDVIDQVTEGLFGYDHSESDNRIIPNLATGYGNWVGNSYTLQLRQGVEFHDGTILNADAVKFTFDRLQYFMDNGMLMTSSLYEYYDPLTDQMQPIINNVEVVSEYTVIFHLNAPYGAFESLLAFESSFILSPISTPPMDYIDSTTGTLVGTGPFVYENYIPDTEVNFRAFENYWDGEPNIDFLKFRYIQDDNERADLLASGEIHIILNPPRNRKGEFDGNPDFTIDAIESATTFYIGMNNHWINRDLREAISYAIDYDYLLNDIVDYDVVRSKSPIPNGILYSDENFNVPAYDLIYARAMMQIMGYGVGFDLYDDAAWESSTFLTLNYTYDIGNQVREDFLYQLQDNLGKIGIEVLDAGMDYISYVYRLIEINDLHREMLQLFMFGWGADYNDPSNFINNLFTNRTTAFNTVNYDGFSAAVEAGRDPFNLWDNVQLLMEAALTEPDQIIREQYYYRIQQLLVEEDMPWAYGFVPLREVWYDSEIQGFQWNAMERLNFMGVSGILYEETGPTELVFATGLNLVELDPLNSWDAGSWDVIDQVAEGLFGYDYTDPYLPIIPRLAVDFGTWNGDTYTVELREGVIFHDGTPFNADTVKWTFDRIQYFLDNGMLVASDLYYCYDDVSGQVLPIISSVEVINEYIVSFHLNMRYSAIEALLAFESSFILSPTSTPATDYIDTYTGTLVGTGPFVFENYVTDFEANFRAFENYWNGEPSIDYLKFRFVFDETERTEMLLNGEAHMTKGPNSSLSYLFDGNPDFVLPSMDSTTEYYLAMNNYWIDKDLREAISYAFDYNYIGNIFNDGENFRLRSPIPNGIMFADDSFNIPTTDVIYARTIMQSIGYGVGLDLYDDAAWEASTFLSINYTYNYGNLFREQLLYSLQESLGKIGIEVLDAGMDYIEFWNRVIEDDGKYREMLQLYWMGWGADFNDPSDYINNLFSNRTRTYNTVLYNGYDAAIEAGRDPFNLWDNIQLLMEAAIAETDPLGREQYYARIQQLLVEEDMPWVFGYVPINRVWYRVEVQYIMNSLNKVYFHELAGFPDTSPPETTLILNGELGDNDWFVSDVYASFEATDHFTGVFVTGYSFDGIEWFPYDPEGDPLLIEESTTIYYISIDNAGNYEEVKSMDISIDKNPPESYVYENGILNINLEYFGEVTVSISAWDDISGVATTYYSFDNVEWFTGDNFVISELGTTDYYYYSVDIAGNEELVQSGSVTLAFRPENDPTVIYGVGYDPFEIDPLRAWDIHAYAIIDQVVEGLFAYDLTDPNLGIILRLASDFGTWSLDGLSYTVELKQGVVFHDGTPFDASTVKWTFDRMMYFIDSGSAYNDAVYRFLDGTPIISSVDVVNTYTVRFNLNGPFAGLEALLCFTGSAILSPTSTSATELLDPLIDALIGTGPFELESYIQGTGVSFVAYQDYWNGPANFDDLWYLFIEDTMVRTEALLDGYIDFLDSPDYSMLSQFEADPDNYLVLNTQSTQVNYLSINNQQIDTAFRQAIAHAFDYEFIIAMYPDSIRSESILAEGMLYSDWSSDHPVFDIVAARQILLDNGIAFGLDPYDDSSWTDLVDSGLPLAIFNFTFNVGNMVREDMYYMLKENLRLIGIELVEVAVSWSEFIQLFLFAPHRLELFTLGWIPDFNDPFAVLNYLFTPGAMYNFGLVDDPYLQSLMDQGIAELDPVVRQSIYSELQSYFIEELLPLIPILNPMLYFAHDSNFDGFNWNAFEKIWFYSISIDSELPTWQPEPTDQAIELGDHLSYQVSAYDESGIEHYWISDTDNFAIDSNGVITTTTLLEVGVYELEIRAYDPYENYCTATIQVTVQDTTAPLILPEYDTIPSEITIIYTRSTQILGNIIVMDPSLIVAVVLSHYSPTGGENGFVFETYPQDYLNNIIVKTTSSLEVGRHEITLHIYDGYGNILLKKFNVTVFRTLNLKLSGELDYLEKEDVKISIGALLVDAETNMEVDPLWISDMGVVIRVIIWDPSGSEVSLSKARRTFTHVTGGIFRWQSHRTIDRLDHKFFKGLYLVTAEIYFHDTEDPSLSYYYVNIDVIEFHIDPPGGQELDLGVFLAFTGFGGLLTITMFLVFFNRRKHRKK